jgi:polyisoprenyl-phosphate glycosyltransferase
VSAAPKKLLSIVVPVFNEEGNIEPLHAAVEAALLPLADRYDWEYVFTDNHSNDATFAELTRLSARDPRVRVFRFSRNFGFQRSIFTGYLKARGDAAIQIDCDLQDPPELIVDFVKRWEEGYSVVYGVRKKRVEGVLITLTRKVFYRLIDWLSEDKLPHDAGDFRLVDRQVLDVLTRIEDQRPYLRGTLATLGFNQLGVEYDRKGRIHGESKFRFKDLLGLAMDGILAHSIIPLRAATWVGLAVSGLTLLGILVYVIGFIGFGRDWPPGFATTTVLILSSLSLNAVFLGIIGEYVGRIYIQVRRRPLTVIEHNIDSVEAARVDHRVARPAVDSVELANAPAAAHDDVVETIASSQRR